MKAEDMSSSRPEIATSVQTVSSQMLPNRLFLSQGIGKTGLQQTGFPSSRDSLLQFIIAFHHSILLPGCFSPCSIFLFLSLSLCSSSSFSVLNLCRFCCSTTEEVVYSLVSVLPLPHTRNQQDWTLSLRTPSSGDSLLYSLLTLFFSPCSLSLSLSPFFSLSFFCSSVSAAPVGSVCSASPPARLALQIL